MMRVIHCGSGKGSRMVARLLRGCCVVAFIQTATMLMALASEAGQEEWLQGNRVKLRPGGFDGQTLVTMEIGQGGDVWIRQEAKEKGAVAALTLLLVGGKAVAVAGGELRSGTELEVLDRAGLQLQLVEHLLSRAYPDGPDSVNGHEKIAVQEKKEPIQIGTTGSKGYFSPPWSVVGQATPLATGKVGFDFTFSFAAEKSNEKPNKKANKKTNKLKPSKLKFAGIWQRDPRTPHFDDRLPLEGWKIYLLGTRSGEHPTQYGAVPTEKYETLGDLRQALQRQP
ncbi:MAG TPA: hypothetical protein VFI05_09775 [Nitrospiraceae bacterium]|nr:hypothetical protein [Nitrospiraceae bacterium]